MVGFKCGKTPMQPMAPLCKDIDINSRTNLGYAGRDNWGLSMSKGELLLLLRLDSLSDDKVKL